MTESDVFMPNWEFAPLWAQWHVVDFNGKGSWYESCPTVELYVYDGEDLDGYEEQIIDNDETEFYDWSGGDDKFAYSHYNVNVSDLDWRNSLRAKP